MKKYLIRGALALVVCGCMISCQDHDEFVGNVIQAKTQAFDEAFVEAYGEIQAGHDWGFGSVGQAIRTRSDVVGSNTNAKEWALKYKVPAKMTAEEKALVRKYFQAKYKPTDEPFDYTNFFVQHVYKGGDNPGENSSEKHHPADSSTEFVASDKMNKLTCGAQNGADLHINNFNNAQAGYTGDVWDGKTYKDGYTGATEPPYNLPDDLNNALTYNDDQIMLMENAGTYRFGFSNSLQDGQQYNKNFVRVSGNTIMAWAQTNSIDTEGADVSGMQFVGFDYDANWQNGWKNEANGSMYLAHEVEEGTTGAYQWKNDGSPYTGKWILDGQADGYYSDWIIRVTDGQGNTSSDGPAPQPKTIPQVYEVTQETAPSAYYEVWKGKRVTDIGRVMAEDLGSSDKNDMDYNDVVFEARIVTPYTEIRQMESEGATEYNLVSNVDINNTSYTASDGTPYANIKLLAAGGTIPITVAGIDVHNAFGGIGKTTMINTENPNMTNGTYATCGATDLEKDGGSKDFEYTTIDAIPIAAQYANGVVEIKNTYGKVPHKICVPTTAPWPIERVEMNTAYGNKFGSGLNGATGGGYVQYRTVQFWTYAVPGNVNNLEGFGQSIGDVFDETRTASGTVNGQTTYTATLMDAVNTTYPTVESGSGWTTVWTRGDNDGYLYNDGSSHGIYIDRANFSGITVGSKVRIYGVYRSGFKVKTNIGDVEFSEANYNQAGYIELDVADNNYVNFLTSNGLSITGERFTVTDVAIKVAAQQEYTIPERIGTVIWTGSQDLGWGSGITLGTNLFAGAGEGTKIRVYGIGHEAGDNSWQVVLTQNIDGWPNVPGCTAQTYWTKGNVEGGIEVEWTLTAEGAAAVLANQTVVRGPNFTVKYVTIDNSGVVSDNTGNESENNDNESNTIWTSSDSRGTAIGYGNEVVVGGNMFTSASSSTKIRLNCQKTDDGWQFFAKYNDANRTVFKQIGNYNQTTIDQGYVEFEIGDALDNLKANGMVIHGNLLKITSIQLI